VRRTATRRREHREQMLRDYFARGATIALPTARISIRDRRGQPLASLAEGLLVGVLGSAGETLGIARVKRYDPERQDIVVETPVARDRITGLVAGRVTVDR
jgi:hypothetical protein